MLLDVLERDNSTEIFLSQSWLNDGILDAEISFERFNLFHRDHVGRSQNRSLPEGDSKQETLQSLFKQCSES